MDELWFYYTTAHECICFPTDEKVPERERQTVQSTKLMLAIVGNPNGFHLIEVLPNECKFNASYDVKNLHSGVSEWRQGQKGGATRRSVVHANNATPRTRVISTSFLEENGMNRVNYPPYSPDLALSDFCLFGFIKNRLNGTSFDEGGNLLSGLEAILVSIEKSTLDRVFLE
jgi:hypothetical protein